MYSVPKKKNSQTHCAYNIYNSSFSYKLIITYYVTMLLKNMYHVNILFCFFSHWIKTSQDENINADHLFK